MTKHLMTGVAAAVLISGAAFAQIYAPPPPPPGTVVVPAPPPSSVPETNTTTGTTVAPGPDGDHNEITIHKELDRKGNTVIEKEGIAGSSDTHTKTETDRDGGTTTTTETTTKPR